MKAPKAFAALLSHLAQQLDGEIYTDPYRRALWSTDASIYQMMPLAVVLPRHRRDVVRVVRWAAEHQVPLVPRGGGTSLSGQVVGSGVVLDFSKYMNRIVHLDVEAQQAVVEPGVVLDQLNAEAGRHGLLFGPDVSTASRANLGGMIGNNSSGARSILYGRTVDHVIELEAVLADGSVTTLGPLSPEELEEKCGGESLEAQAYRTTRQVVEENREEILRRYPKILRRVSGYNLDQFLPESRTWFKPPWGVQYVRRREAQLWPQRQWNLARLLVGAEGTLGVVTQARVHLVPRPRHRGIVVLHFDSLSASCAAVPEVLPLEPSAVEMFDRLIISMARQSRRYRQQLEFVVGDPESMLIVEFSADDSREVRQRVEQLVGQMERFPGMTHALPVLDAGMCDHIWNCRKAALPLLMSIPGLKKPIAFIEDPAVDPQRLPQFIQRFRRILEKHDRPGAIYGHASVGCLHVRPLLDTRDPEDLQHIRSMLQEVAELVLEFGGAMSGEHGDGMARSFLNEKLFGPRLYRAFCQVKEAFDPQGILNPGKVVHGPEPTENLRLSPEYAPREPQTVMSFERYGGFARAVELCNGSAVCRKLRGGTMCPSYRATLDEEHSTRGRANALRMVMAGQVPQELASRRLLETFELCLQCKACKTECPSSVDVAAMKAEVLQHHYRQRGVPWSVRFQAHIARWNRLGYRLIPWSNWLPRLPLLGRLVKGALGIDPRRSLPRFSGPAFPQWFKQQEPQFPVPEDAPLVVLLDDCLTSYTEPEVNRAAVELLRRAGCRVELARLYCCGRPMISKGLLEQAQALARENLQRLAPLAQQGAWILGTEPSCISALVDEYLDLVPGRESQLVAGRTRSVEQFLVEQDLLERILPEELSPAGPVMLHGHCHQKALWGTEATQVFLQAIAGTGGVEVLDSGCCGMAGSFGYEHYELSMKIGELVLLPRVRDNPHKDVVAPGTSCRHQILDGTGRRAEHPLVYLWRHLEESDQG